jgi:tetratricopeptide (TPR) repeat protein
LEVILLSEKEKLFNTLLDSVQSLKSPYTQAITLTHISEQFLKLNEKRSEEFFNKALSIAEQMPNDLEKLSLMQNLIGTAVNVVRATKDIEKLETIINIAKSIYLPYNKLYNLVDILKIFFRLLGKDKTLKLINDILPAIDEITSKSYRFEILSEIITVLCDMSAAFNDLELIKQAQQNLDLIEVSSFYYIALLSIAKAFLSYAETNQDQKWISNALESLMKLPEMSSLTTALIDVSFTLLRMEHEKQAEEIIEKAINYAEQIEETSRRSVALSYIAKSFIKLNEPSKAKQQLLRAVEAAHTITDQKLLNLAWKSVIEALNELSSNDQLSLIKEIVETIENLSNIMLRAFALNHIITVHNDSGQIAKSFFQEILEKAVSTVKSIRNKLVRETAAITLAEILIEKSSSIADDFIVNHIYELVEEIKDPKNAVYLFTDITHVVNSFGREKEVEDLINGTKPFVNLISNVLEKARALIYVTKGCLELDLQNKFNDLIKEITELINEIETPKELGFVLTNIAKLLAQSNKKERAMLFLHQALEVSNELPNELEKSDALSSIANVVLSL